MKHRPLSSLQLFDDPPCGRGGRQRVNKLMAVVTFLRDIRRITWSSLERAVDGPKTKQIDPWNLCDSLAVGIMCRLDTEIP